MMIKLVLRDNWGLVIVWETVQLKHCMLATTLNFKNNTYVLSKPVSSCQKLTTITTSNMILNDIMPRFNQLTVVNRILTPLQKLSVQYAFIKEDQVK